MECTLFQKLGRQVQEAASFSSEPACGSFVQRLGFWGWRPEALQEAVPGGEAGDETDDRAQHGGKPTDACAIVVYW